MAFLDSAALKARQLYDEYRRRQSQTASSAVQPRGLVHRAMQVKPVQQGMRQVSNLFRPVVQRVAQQPLVNFNPVGVNVPRKNLSPTIGQYTQGQVVKPIQQGVQQIRQPGIVNKAMGGLQVAGGAFSATPIGALSNVATGVVTGGLRTLRTGQPLNKSINTAIAQPTSVGAEGLGIKNPYIAAGVDLVAMRNPKLAVKDVGKIVNRLKGYSPNAFNIHPADQEIIADFINMVQTKGGKRALDPRISTDIQRLAEHYIGKKAQHLSNDKLAKVFDALLASAARSRGEDVLQSPFPKMGFVNNRKDTNTGPLNRQARVDPINTPSLNTQQIPKILPGQKKQNLSLSQESVLTGEKAGATSPQLPGSRSGNSSGRSIAQVPNSENPYFNTNKLNIKPESKKLVNQTLQEVKPQLEKVVGKPLSNNEIIATTNNSAKVLRKVVDRQQTADFEAALLNTRQKLASMSESGTVDKEYLDTLMTLKSHATDIGRKLQSFNIKADPKSITAKNAIMEAVTKVEKDSNKILEAAKGVDFNDFNQATTFYRKFVKPGFTEWSDTLRYNSMLSSPNTHINNAFSNYLNSAAVAPLEKTITGGLDFLKSAVTGKERQAFAGEGAAYAKGYAQNLGEASHRFVQAFKGQGVSGNLDTRMIPLAQKGVKGAIEKTLTVPTKLLEASDQFFTTLTKGGEKAALELRRSKGVNVGNIETKAAENAAYRLFRSELGDEKQGHLLDGIDKVTGLIQQARSSDNMIVSNIAKFTLPFIRTPMNILKQGIEYSPAGLATLGGAKNKTEQVSKMIIGASAATATYLLASSGRTTWAMPTDEKQRQAFQAAGMQPYSVKIGDQWVSYAKLPPAIAFNIALVSAIHAAQEKKELDDSQVETILDGVAKWGNFFADQSYLKNIGDMIAASKGDKEGVGRFISNYPQQLVPFRAMLGWIARTLDPYQRKVDPDLGFLERQIELLKTQVPGLSQSVTARLDERGNPIESQNRVLNAFSPVRITTENAEGKARFDTRTTELQANAYIKPLKQEIDDQVDTVTPNITNNVYEQVIADGNFTEEQKQEIFKKVHQRVRTRVKSAVMRKRAKDILALMQNVPGTTREEKKIYLLKLKSSGLLNKDVAQALSQQ